jgi:acetyl/propionyl-CoA carboxylase alpha subunit
VRELAQLAPALAAARRLAESAFGDGTLLLERYLPAPRHIEVQVFADGHGNFVHLGERDCSIQRRHQKLIEEAPAPALPEELRARLRTAALVVAREIGYLSAGTVEFLYDGAEFYFMEMNTRLQVEHPVTELVTGIDIVKAQIGVAQGEHLQIAQDDVQLTGHALECRINAEDPTRDFAPSPGEVRTLRMPGGPGIRIDSHLYAWYRVPPFYDSLLAKVIAWGRDRNEAIMRMRRALSEMQLEGFPTTLPFHLRLMHDDRFRRGDVHTRYVENDFAGTA